MPKITHQGPENIARSVRLTNEIMDSYINGNPQFCSNSIGAADENGISVPGRFQIEYPTESSDLSVGAWSPSRTYVWLDDLDKAISGID